MTKRGDTMLCGLVVVWCLAGGRRVQICAVARCYCFTYVWCPCVRYNSRMSTQCKPKYHSTLGSKLVLFDPWLPPLDERPTVGEWLCLPSPPRDPVRYLVGVPRASVPARCWLCRSGLEEMPLDRRLRLPFFSRVPLSLVHPRTSFSGSRAACV